MFYIYIYMYMYICICIYLYVVHIYIYMQKTDVHTMYLVVELSNLYISGSKPYPIFSDTPILFMPPGPGYGFVLLQASFWLFRV